MNEYYGIIYLATNTKNNKKYVGKTIQSFKSRVSQHKYCSTIDRNVKFYNAVKKHCWENFKWEVIDYAYDESDLSLKEIKYIQQYDSYKNGYNSTLGGEGTVGYGIINEDIAFQVKEILRDTSLSCVRIGEVFNISKEIVESIYYGNSWSYVLVEGFNPNMERSKKGRDWDCINLKDEEVIKIKEMLKNKVKIKEIAEKFNTTISTISHINNGRIWRHIEVEGFSYSSGRKYGHEHANSKLSEEDVINIKKLIIEDRLNLSDIAKIYKVNKSTISKISKGQTYKNVFVEGFSPQDRNAKGSKNGMSKLTESDVIEIKKMIKDGHKNREISKLFNVLPNLISRIRTGQRWGNIKID